MSQKAVQLDVEELNLDSEIKETKNTENTYRTETLQEENLDGQQLVHTERVEQWAHRKNLKTLSPATQCIIQNKLEI